MIIVNGEFTDNATINLDEGYMFGRGVFETILVTDRPLFLDAHLLRLKKGITALNIKNSIEEKFVLNIIESYNINNCVLKIIVTDKNIVLTTRANPYKKEHYEQGLKLKVSNIKRNPFSHFTYIKSLNYIDNMLERELAQKEGFDEVLFLNIEDKLAEGSASNIFFIKNNKLYTPSLSCGILNGIIRDWVVNNYDVIEGNYSLEDLLTSEGAFLTNSLMGIIKIASINNYVLNYDKTINKLKEKYSQVINI